MQTTYADKIQIELWVDNNTLKKKPSWLIIFIWEEYFAWFRLDSRVFILVGVVQPSL